MVYRSREEIQNIKPRTKIWACAYKFSINLIVRPTYGMLRGYEWDNDLLFEEEYPAYFVPYVNGGDAELDKSKAVQIDSRIYADTYEECVELFDSLVNEKVE